MSWNEQIWQGNVCRSIPVVMFLDFADIGNHSEVFRNMEYMNYFRRHRPGTMTRAQPEKPGDMSGSWGDKGKRNICVHIYGPEPGSRPLGSISYWALHRPIQLWSKFFKAPIVLSYAPHMPPPDHSYTSWTWRRWLWSNNPPGIYLDLCRWHSERNLPGSGCSTFLTPKISL